MAAFIHINAEGVVVAACEGAESLLGTCVALPCQDAVRAELIGGEGICTQSCARELAQGSLPGRDVRRALVRGRAARLVCARMGEGAVVAVLPDDEVDAKPLEQLTQRENSVLALVAQGLTSREIASRLGISVCTVRTHVANVLTKLEVHTRAEAVARALGIGLISE